MKKREKMLPRVSFIIPTLNAASMLPKCLLAIRQQDYPKHKVEIIISDGGSTDTTKNIAETFNAVVVHNPEKLHEPGKSRAAAHAHGDILFFTDADNILSHTNWIKEMVQPYIDYPDTFGFMPQTIPAPDTNIIDTYLGYLFTDPFTWFVYRGSGNPKYYKQTYTPRVIHKTYQIFSFPENRLPLFGFSQGVGIQKSFKRDGIGYADDLLGGIKLMLEGKSVAYVPSAGVYHYHVDGLIHFIQKYRWRVRNNIIQKIKGMGFTQRISYFDDWKKIRTFLFLPYAFTFIGPLLDGIILAVKEKSFILLLHPFMTFIMACIIVFESCSVYVCKSVNLGEYK